jgi:hypothetical protein
LLLYADGHPPSLAVACIKMPVKIGEGEFMLWTVVVILLILWLLGALGTVSLPILSGNAVHVLLVVVIVVVVLQLLRGRKL